MIADRSYHSCSGWAGWRRTWTATAARSWCRPPTAPAARRRCAATSWSPSPRPRPKPEGPKRFYLGGQVYEGWTNVPDRYKVMDAQRTPSGTQIVPLFSFKW